MTEKDKIQKEIIHKIVENNFNGFVRALTGLGKGKIMVETIKILNPTSILYLCNSTDLRDKTFKDEIIKWGAEKYLDRIDFRCYQTTQRWKGKEYDLVIGDEADFSLTDKYSNVYFNNTFKHKLLFSGSLSQEKERILKQIVPIIYEIHVVEGEEKKIVNKASITHVNYLLNSEENKKYLSYNNAFKRILAGKIKLSSHEQFKLKQIQLGRKHFLGNLTTSVSACRKLLATLYKENPKFKALIFCNSKEQADKVCKHSYYSGNEDLNNLERFDNDEIQVLSVVAKIDRGVNISGVDNIVFEAPGKSETALSQKSGRGRRLSVDDIVHLFFLIPYFKNLRGEITPTIVKAHVEESTINLNTTQIKIKNYVN